MQLACLAWYVCEINKLHSVMNVYSQSSSPFVFCSTIKCHFCNLISCCYSLIFIFLIIRTLNYLDYFVESHKSRWSRFDCTVPLHSWLERLRHGRSKESFPKTYHENPTRFPTQTSWPRVQQTNCWATVPHIKLMVNGWSIYL